MSVATRRPSLTPSSPASHRGSRVDLSINTSTTHAPPAPDSYAASSHAKFAVGQLLSNLSHPKKSHSRMSSPKNSHSPVGSEPQGLKRKYDSDTDASTTFKVASATEIQLPSDPLRRASIINLATAAAAAVLQSQVGQRHTLTQAEQEQKRQRVEQLGMLIEQARKASVGSLSQDITRHVESASQNVAIATALASHLGLTPQSSAASSPAPGTPVPTSPTKAPTSASTSLAVPVMPATPKSPLSSEPITAGQETESETAQPTEDVQGIKVSSSPQQLPAPLSPVSTPAITVNDAEAKDSASSSRLPAGHMQTLNSSEGFLDEAKEVAHTYSRFYRFEKEWAQKALELERRRSSVRIDPLFNPNPTLAPLSADTSDDQATGATSPKQHSAPESRVMSRGASPFGDASAGPSSRTPQSVPSGSFSSSHRASSKGLASVLSNFAELIEHRQRSCSGLEALAKQAKELPVKRLSQPNPQFRIAFGEFSWSKNLAGTSSTGAAARGHSTSHMISEGDDDGSDVSSPDTYEDSVHSEAVAPAGLKPQTPSKPSLLQVLSERKIKEEADSDGEAPATPRSTMSIASML
ncbi:related to Hgl1p, required for dimorphism and teliospore formation [Ustilago sp. UG-2017b]|nr:related to Hgl1p, required for dimorphism and teliospore formation [Ustilago sp. UG-2017b]